MTNTKADRPLLHGEVPENLTGIELLEAARRAVRQLRGARNLPAWSHSAVDDTVSDVVEACLVAQDHGTVVTSRYVYGVASNLVHRDRSMCSADARALRMLAELTAKLEQEQGHCASAAQIDALATKIIEEWDRPSRRPTRDFHHRPVILSLDSPVGSTQDLVDLIPEPPAATGDPGAALDELDELAEAASRAHDKAEHSAVRRACWDTLATMHGAPRVTGPVPKNRITQARAAIVRHPDGAYTAIGLALRHAGQGVDSTLTAALFTPFEGVDREGRRQVVDVLRRYRPHAVELWTAALSASSSMFFRRR